MHIFCIKLNKCIESLRVIIYIHNIHNFFVGIIIFDYLTLFWFPPPPPGLGHWEAPGAPPYLAPNHCLSMTAFEFIRRQCHRSPLLDPLVAL